VQSDRAQFVLVFMDEVGWDSSVGIVNHYGLESTGIKFQWGWDFPHPSRLALEVHPASYTMCTGSLPGVKWLGCGIDHPAPSSAKVEGTVELYIYSLYRPSWPVLGWTLSFIFMDEVIRVSDRLDSFGGFPIGVKTANVDVWQGFSFTNFKVVFCLTKNSATTEHCLYSLVSFICSVNPVPGAGGHVNARFLCFGVALSVLDRSNRGPNFLWVVWI
jgi:hypothetical protein